MTLEQAIQEQRLGRFNEARDCLRKFVASHDPHSTVEHRLLLGKLCILGGSHLFEEAYECLANLESNQSEASLHASGVARNLLGLLERYRGNREQARRILEGNLTRYVQPCPQQSQCLHYLGLLASDAGDSDLAQQKFFAAYETAENLQLTEAMAEICDSIAGLLLKMGKTKTALAFCRKSLKAKEQLGDQYGTAITLGTLGRIYLAQSDYPQAEQAFEADLKIARELDDRTGMAIMLNSLGDVARLAGEFETASGYYQESSRINQSPINHFHVRIGLCWIHLGREQIEPAFESLELAKSHLTELSSVPELEMIAEGLEGVLAARRGDKDDACRLLVSAIDKLSSIGLFADTIVFRYELRDVYCKNQQQSEAIRIMSEALDLLSELGSERGVDDVESWLRTVDNPRLTRVAIERHFPGPMVDNLLSGELRLPSPKKQTLTILFSDLRGFTTFSEQNEPEQVVELLNEWFAEATRAIQRQGGIIDKFIGDAVMALFGVDSHDQETPASAVRAALDMNSALKSMNQRNAVLGITKLEIGIGIATGDALVGFMGSHLRQTFTAIGDTVNTAARLESATRNFDNCSIIIDSVTQQFQKQFNVARTKSLGELKLKGKIRSVETFQVIDRLS